METKKILVGMSGGVDSSLAAALLVEQGFDVTGVFLKVWADEGTEQALFSCPWGQDLADAQAVAQQLGIELLVRNVQREYWDRVVTQFLDGYRQGLTPNPDILCNSEIKFGILYDWAMQQGFDAVATGHYARVFTRENHELHRGTDDRKDQTYFLWKIDRGKFEHILFPIGHLPKDQVRVEAESRGLVTAAKRDSQGICFLGKVNVREWLRDELHTQPGNVILRDGTVVGRHQGAQLYTLGQRDGLGVTGGTGTPLYVVKRDVARNQLLVATEPPKQRELHATNLNWLQVRPMVGETIQARIRHGQQPQEAWVSAISNQHILIEFTEPQTAIAPGQSVVFSQGSRILGGGIIQ